MEPSPVSAALVLARAGDSQGAATILSALMIEELPSLGTVTVAVNNDRYSLNSLNGTVTQADGTTSFFKLHVEEGEERTVQEYYRAELLHRAGWPVERPWFASTTPGRQFLLYHFQHHQRLADAARHAEMNPPNSHSTLVVAQEVLDKLIGADDCIAARSASGRIRARTRSPTLPSPAGGPRNANEAGWTGCSLLTRSAVRVP